MSTATETRSTWTIDAAHSHVEFAVRHMMIATVKGRFAEVAGTLQLEGDLADAAVQVEIQAGSIDTRSADRDKHLRSADFLDVENFPVITFESRRVEPTGEDTFDVIGDLTIHGETREVVLKTHKQGEATSPWGQTVAGFRATTEIDRADFGLTWNQALETGGVLVSDRVRITIEVEAVRN